MYGNVLVTAIYGQVNVTEVTKLKVSFSRLLLWYIPAEASTSKICFDLPVA